MGGMIARKIGRIAISKEKPSDRRKAGRDDFLILRKYKIQYYLFFDEDPDHAGDWEWTCHFLNTGVPSLISMISKVVYHHHKTMEEVSWENLKYEGKYRVKVFVGKSKHGLFHTRKDEKDYDVKWLPWLIVYNLDRYNIDKIMRSIYIFEGRWGQSDDSPRGPRTKDYYDFSK
jgi:hypothetical protein